MRGSQTTGAQGAAGDPRADLAGLTAREREILGYVAAGYSNAAIARTLWLTPKTVETHIGNLYRKLGLPSDDHAHRRVLATLVFLGLPSDPGPL